jgi:aminopeptidase N
VGAAYNPDSKDFYEVARYGRETVDFLSHQMPGIPFPYPNITVFNGSGGMEFPMMVNDGSYGLSDAAEVTAHEIAHTYFPFYMGINERKYAWMDEGWAQFLPNDMQFKLKPDAKTTYSPQTYNAIAYSKFSGNQMDMPMMVPSVLLEGTSYGYASYFRPAVAYAMLRNLLGDELFKKALQEYMRRWNGKHPMPYDFFFTFNEVAGEDLSWFWKPWFFDQGYPDLGIKNTATNGKNNLIIERKGDMPVPIHLKITYTDNTEDTIKETAAIWKDGAREYVVVLSPAKTVKQAQLGNTLIPDSNMANNSYAADKK